MATLSNADTARRLISDLEIKPRKQRDFAEVWEYYHTGAEAIRWAVFTKTEYNDLNENPNVGAKLLLWSATLGRKAKVGDLAIAMGKRREEQEKQYRQRPRRPLRRPRRRG